MLAVGSICGAARQIREDGASAQITIQAGREACQVELDAAPVGNTDAKGRLVLRDIEPIDHYIHVRCPGAKERAYWVEPRAGQSITVRAKAANDGPALSPLEAAEAKSKLRRLVQQAVQKRAAGQFDEAIRDLHEAAKMDAENSDLHRELGITFLLERDWKRARVEMLEALKHDPTDADAHNGLGYALDKMGDTPAALDEFRKATHLDPDDSSYRQHYLEALAKLTAEQGAKRK